MLKENKLDHYVGLQMNVYIVLTLCITIGYWQKTLGYLVLGMAVRMRPIAYHEPGGALPPWNTPPNPLPPSLGVGLHPPQIPLHCATRGCRCCLRACRENTRIASNVLFVVVRNPLLVELLNVESSLLRARCQLEWHWGFTYIVVWCTWAIRVCQCIGNVGRGRC